MGSIQEATSGTIVGALACQQDSYSRVLETEVISCVKREPQTNAQKGKKSKGTAESAKQQEDTWLVEFANSVLFPEGKVCDPRTVIRGRVKE